MHRPKPALAGVSLQLDANGRIVLLARTLRSFAFGLNSVALGFTADGEPLPDLLGRGAPEGNPMEST